MEQELEQRAQSHRQIENEIAATEGELAAFLAAADVDTKRIATAQGRLSALQSAREAQAAAIERLRSGIAGERALHERKAKLDTLWTLADAAAKVGERSAHATDEITKALAAYIDAKVEAVDELASLRGRFISEAGADLRTLTEVLEAEGVDTSYIRAHWIGTLRSAIDRQLRVESNQFSDLLDVAVGTVFQERELARVAAQRALRLEQQERDDAERKRRALEGERAEAEEERRRSVIRARREAEENEQARASIERAGLKAVVI